MKNGIFAAIIVAIFAVSAAQAEDGRMSNSKLNSLGLTSMEPATDAQGMEIRGEGRAFAAGAFIAVAGTSASGPLAYNFASARRPNAIAGGNGFAVADFAQVINGTTFVFSANAFGASAAFAP